MNRLTFVILFVVGIVGVTATEIGNTNSDRTAKFFAVLVSPASAAQSGMHLLLEVDFNPAIRQRLGTTADEIRMAMRHARIGYTGLSVSASDVRFRLTDIESLAATRELLTSDDVTVTTTEDGNVTLVLNELVLQTLHEAVLTRSIEIIRHRMRAAPPHTPSTSLVSKILRSLSQYFSANEPIIERQGAGHILIQLPNVDDRERTKLLITKTAKLDFRIVDTDTSVADARAGRLPAGSELLDSYNEIDGAEQPIQYVVHKPIMLSGENLVDAQLSLQSGKAVIAFRFDAVGARKFGEMTTYYVGRPFAIVFDNKVISAPIIREPINSNRGLISGNFTEQEAADLAMLLRFGALPAPLTIVEERVLDSL